jgi:hypothetical protein
MEKKDNPLRTLKRQLRVLAFLVAAGAFALVVYLDTTAPLSLPMAILSGFTGIIGLVMGGLFLHLVLPRKRPK